MDDRESGADPTTSLPGPGRPFLAPPSDAEPRDRCVRCGRPTPAGVSLCEADNPGHIRGPSSTQMHATILAGVLLGFVGFLFLARLVSSPAGPYGVSIMERRADGAGGVVLILLVTNEGPASGVANCRVTRDGIPRPDDYAFRVQRIEAGGSLELERPVPAPPGGTWAYEAEKVGVICT